MFTFHEHFNKMNKKEREIIETALEAFEEETGLRTAWTTTDRQQVDGELDIFFDHPKPLHLYIEVKTEVRPHHLDAIIRQNQENGPLIVMAEYILPKVKTELQQQDIPYIETTGNAFLRKPHYFILIDIKKEVTPTKEVNRAFTNPNHQQPVVPPLLAYTDLMNTGNQRCIDTATKIYEQHLQSKFK